MRYRDVAIPGRHGAEFPGSPDGRARLPRILPLRLPGGRPAEIDLEERSGAGGDRGEQAGGLGQQLPGVETGGADLLLEEGCVGAARGAQQPGRGQRRPGQQPAADDQAEQPQVRRRPGQGVVGLGRGRGTGSSRSLPAAR